MDALDLIKEHLTIENVHELLTLCNFHSISTHGDYLRAKCAIHGGNNPTSFVFSVKKGLYYCQACGAFGDCVQLVEHTFEYTFVEAVKYVLAFLKLEENDVQIKKRSTKLKKDIKEWLDLMQKHEAKTEKYTTQDVDLKNVVAFRHFDKSTLEKFSLQFAKSYPFVTREGKEISVLDRLVMPICYNKEQVAVALRRTKNNDMAKWLFQPTNFNKRNIVYNLEQRWYNEIVLVEGIFDVWAYDEVGVHDVGSCLGVDITDEQFGILLNVTDTLVLSLDGDEAGIMATFKNIEKLKKCFNLYIIDFTGNDDPCEVAMRDKEQLRQYYSQRMHYTEWLSKHKKENEQWKKKSKHYS